MSAPTLLFVPASGAQGSGEYYRSLAIARAAQARWPAARICFIVNSAAGYARQCPFETVLVEGSPTYNTAAVNATIDRMQPDIVVFDSAGRVGQLAHARRRNAATVYVSSRFKTRWKGFRLRRMRVMDHHWLAWPRLLEGELNRWERFKLRLLGRPRAIFLDPVFEPVVPERAAALRRELGVGDERYLLFCAGGGGYERSGVPAPETFARAAIEVSRACGLKTLWVKGPNYEGGNFDNAGILALPALRPDQMTDLLAGAHVATINGGSLLLQALALHTPAVAAPVAGDQPGRIAACERQGVAVGASLDPTALAGTTLALLGDGQRLAQLRARLDAAGLGNGSLQAVEAMEQLLERRR